eukprot:TRINITY_DN60518_c0_g1_i1.p1 TRINITY_DN60518_c0_g1~~TRINITY_DN60518_c0_g1_i1.p1  ORF type:complete len:1192 (-),score=101.36 TRINITY_DN60518_c0_g1_i1:204-3779(-)
MPGNLPRLPISAKIREVMASGGIKLYFMLAVIVASFVLLIGSLATPPNTPAPLPPVPQQKQAERFSDLQTMISLMHKWSFTVPKDIVTQYVQSGGSVEDSKPPKRNSIGSTTKKDNRTPKTLVVTGALGCIGSGAIPELAKIHNHIVVVDLSNQTSYFKQYSSKVTFVQGDIRDEHLMMTLVNEAYGVVHLAAMSRVSWCSAAPSECTDINVRGTQVILDTIAAVSAKRPSKNRPWLVMASSREVWGGVDPSLLPVTEATPQTALNGYGESKVVCEKIIHEAVDKHNLVSVVLRFSNVYGAVRDHVDRVIPVFVRSALAGDPLIVGGVGKGVDFTHVSDAGRSVALATKRAKELHSSHANKGVFADYNIASGETSDLDKVAKLIVELAKSDSNIRHLHNDPMFVDRYETKLEKSAAELKYKPQVSLRSGLEKYIKLVKSGGLAPSQLTLDGYTQDVGITELLNLYNTSSTDIPQTDKKSKIVIIGAGIGGTCAATRLQELGVSNWEILEADTHSGGLAQSFPDDKGFIWDIGVHVLFSHFGFFDYLLDYSLPDKEWTYHWRASKSFHTWGDGVYIEYPFQNNLYKLPIDELLYCMTGLIDAVVHKNTTKPANYREWLLQSFGEGVSNTFMIPYNSKVWAHPPEEMNSKWVGERVATPNLKAIVKNTLLQQDAPSWGPNAIFRYPMNGTGAIWEQVFAELPQEKVRFNKRVSEVAPGRVKTADGLELKYDALISTMPMETLYGLLSDKIPKPKISGFKHQTVNLVGVGIKGELPSVLRGTHWLYFAEEKFVFYRVTILSNFSPRMVPSEGHYSLLAEVSESIGHRHVNHEKLAEQVIEGYKLAGMLTEEGEVVSVWRLRRDYGYPVPYVDRDADVHAIDDVIKKFNIWSRGRFGGWKYEVANQDHTCAQGVEAADAAVLKLKELTWYQPDKINGMWRPPVQLRNYRFNRMPLVDIVVSHCHEDLKWLEAVRKHAIPLGFKFQVYIYERCSTEEELKKSKDSAQLMWDAVQHILHRIPLDATGYAPMAYVTHLLEQPRNKMGDVVILLQASQTPTEIDKITQQIYTSLSSGSWQNSVSRLGPVGEKQSTTSLGSVFTFTCEKLILWEKDSPGCPKEVMAKLPLNLFTTKTRIGSVTGITWKTLRQLLKGEVDGQPTSSASTLTQEERKHHKPVSDSVDLLWHVIFGQDPLWGG